MSTSRFELTDFDYDFHYGYDIQDGKKQQSFSVFLIFNNQPMTSDVRIEFERKEDALYLTRDLAEKRDAVYTGKDVTCELKGDEILITPIWARKPYKFFVSEEMRKSIQKSLDDLMKEKV